MSESKSSIPSREIENPEKPDDARWMRVLRSADRPEIPALIQAAYLGEPMLAVTNGHGITAIGGTNPKAKPFPGIDETFAQAAQVRRWVPASLAALKAWASAPAHPDESQDCWRCGGTGFMESDLVAFDSDGNGPVDDLHERCGCFNGLAKQGAIDGVMVDRILLRRHLGPLAGEEVTVGVLVSMKLVFVRGEGWLVAIMGLAKFTPPLLPAPVFQHGGA